MEIDKLKEHAEKAKPIPYAEVWTLDLREHWAAKAEGRKEPRWVLAKRPKVKGKRVDPALQERDALIRASTLGIEELAARYNLAPDSIRRIRGYR